MNRFKIRRNGELYSLTDVIKASTDNKSKISKKKGEYYINKELAQQFLSNKKRPNVDPQYDDSRMTGNQLLQLEQIELDKMRINMEMESYRLKQLQEENQHRTKQMEMEFQMKQLDYQLEMNKLEIKMAEMGLVEVDGDDVDGEFGSTMIPQLIIEFDDDSDEEDDGIPQIQEEWMESYGEDDDEELISHNSEFNYKKAKECQPNTNKKPKRRKRKGGKKV